MAKKFDELSLLMVERRRLRSMIRDSDVSLSKSELDRITKSLYQIERTIVVLRRKAKRLESQQTKQDFFTVLKSWKTKIFKKK